jgi:DNA-binding SARP family transcriptional activator
MRNLEFHVLGSLELRIDDVPGRLAGSKMQAVLFMLLTAEGHQVPLSRLTDAVWGEFPPRSAAKQIRNTVSSLRSILDDSGPRILLTSNGYVLDTAHAVVDQTEFHTYVAEARRHTTAHAAIETYRRALGLWRGPATLPGAGHVVEAVLAGLNEQRLTVIEECVELELISGRHGPLVGELQDLVCRHPLRERLVARLIRALYLCGARARAFAVYEHTRQLLAEELGLRPGTELQEVHRRMLADDLICTAPVRPFVPRQRQAGTTRPCFGDHARRGQLAG